MKNMDDDLPTNETNAIHWQMVEDKNSKAITPEMAAAKAVFKAGFEAAGYTVEDLTIEISSNEEHLYALWKSNGVMYRTSVMTDNDMRPSGIISYIRGNYTRGCLDGAVYDEQSGYLKVASTIFTV